MSGMRGQLQLLVATQLLCAYAICLAHERSQWRIDVGWHLQTKMMTNPERSIVFNAPQARVRGAATQPEARVEVTGANNGAGETDTSLYDDAALLGVSLHSTTFTGGGKPMIPGLLALDWLATKMIHKRNADAGVPEIPGDESMPAFGTLPERWLCYHGSSKVPASNAPELRCGGRLHSSTCSAEELPEHDLAMADGRVLTRTPNR